MSGFCKICGKNPCLTPVFCAESLKGDAQRSKPQSIPQPNGSKRLVEHRASDINPAPVEWLWQGRIAIGKTTLVGGDPGLGKSQLSIFVAATASKGGKFPCNEGSAPKRSVIILCAEDGLADTIVPRLMAADADRSKITIITAVIEREGGRRIFNLSKDLDVLEGLLVKKILDVGLIIIDPVDAYIGAGVDSHKNAAVRAVLEPISEFADRLRTAVLAITHFSKQPGGKAMYRFIGSIAHVGAARVAFAVIADAENEGRVLMLHAKNNLAPAQKGLAFRLEQIQVADGVTGSRVYFDSEYVSGTADEALAAERDSEGRSDKDAAIAFLRVLLADGPLKVKSIQEQAREAGLLGEDQDVAQSKPFRSARNALGIEPYQPKGEKSGGWIWALPDQQENQGDGREHPDPPDQMPSAGQMPSNTRASDRSWAADGRHQMPSGYQMPSNGGASDGKGHLMRNTADDFPDFPEFLRRRDPSGDDLDDFE